jgi:hypothetical protein
MRQGLALVNGSARHGCIMQEYVSAACKYRDSCLALGLNAQILSGINAASLGGRPIEEDGYIV